jgi:alkyldihydroxyacetonephosphate synthase
VISKKIILEIQKVCGEENISFRSRDQIAYARDCSTPSIIQAKHHHFPHRPDLIVWPRNTEEVSKILKIANHHKIPLVPYGAGSGVCGGAIPLQAGIILDLKKLDQILSIDPESLTVTAQAGIMGEIFEQRLQQKGFTLGHFPSSIYTATLGGYLACRSAGQLSTKYGKIEDMILSFTVCLADGRVIHLGESPFSVSSSRSNVTPHPNPLPVKGRGGIDLREIFLGSEGTLGIITEATLKIYPYPETQKYFGVSFPTVSQGLTAIRRFIQAGYRPAIVRLYNPLDSFFFSMHGSDEKPSWTKKFFQMIPQPILEILKLLKTGSFQLLLSQSWLFNRLVHLAFSKSLLILGFEGPRWRVDLEFSKVLEICESEKGEPLGEAPGLQWLKNRYAAGYKMSPIIDQGCFADTMEVATTWSKLEGLYDGVRKAIGQDALVMAHFSHVYPDGASIYFTFASYASNEEKTLKLHRKIWDQALEACLKAGGTVSHHHGIGYLKAKAFIEELGPWMEWFRKTKKFFDPNGILNPGKMGLS